MSTTGLTDTAPSRVSLKGRTDSEAAMNALQREDWSYYQKVFAPLEEQQKQQLSLDSFRDLQDTTKGYFSQANALAQGINARNVERYGMKARDGAHKQVALQQAASNSQAQTNMSSALQASRLRGLAQAADSGLALKNQYMGLASDALQLQTGVKSSVEGMKASASAQDAQARGQLVSGLAQGFSAGYSG